MAKDVDIVCGGVGAVYSKIMPIKSRIVREILKETGVIPAETHELSDYVPGDSPEDVGLYISGAFYSANMIFDEKEHIKSELEGEKNRKSRLVQMAS